jgi:hypothetical protein
MAIPSSLPTGWFNYSPNQKAIWFMDNGVTPDDMRQVGVPEGDISALMQFGYDPARAASVDQQNKLTAEEAARREAEMLRIIEAQKIAEQQSQAEQTRQEAIRQEAARAEAARVEAARVAAEESARQEAIRVAAAQEQARAAAAAEQERLIQAQLAAQQKQQARANFVKYIDPSSSGEAWSVLGSEQMINQLQDKLSAMLGGLDLSKVGEKTVPVYERATIQPVYDYSTDTVRYVALPFSSGGSDYLEPSASDLQNMVQVGEGYNFLGQTVPTYEANIKTRDVKRLYNKDTGEIIEGSPIGQGMFGGPTNYQFADWDFKDLTYAGLGFDANGNPVIRTAGKKSNNAAEFIAPLSIALMAIPGIGQAVGAALLPSGVSVATATAVGNAVVNAGLQVASGVPVEKAILNSAASLGVSQLVPNLSGNVYIDNAVKSVATAALTGGDVGNALANSLIATGGNELLGNTSFTGDKVVDSAIASAITSGVQAAATDGDVGASIIRGGIAGASGQLTKEEKMAESAKSGAGFIGEDVTEPTSVAEPGIDPRILAQGVTGGQFGEGGLLQTGAQVPLDVLQDLMKLRPELVSIIDSGNYYLKVPTADGAYTAYEISPSGQVLNAQPGLSVGETYDPSKTASALEDIIKIEEGKSSQQAVPEGSGLSGSVQPKATDLSPAAQETLLQIGGVLGLGEQDPDAVYEALIGGASGGIGDVALLGYDQLAKLQDEIELIFDEPNLPADAKSEMARIYAEVTNQKRIQEEAIRDQLLNEQQPTEQQVADTGLTVVGQPVNQTPVVSPTTPSVTPPTIAPVVTEPVVSQPSVTEPVVSEPVAQQPTAPDIVTTTPSITQPAQKTELQAEIDRIMRMAVGQETTDLRYDVNKDGRVNSRDAYLVNSGQATIPTAEQYAASQIALPQAGTGSTASGVVTGGQVDTGSTLGTGTVTTESVGEGTGVDTGVGTSTGIVLQNNGDGTVLVLTNNGNASIVADVDSNTGGTLTTGSSVVVDNNTGTASSTGTDTGTDTGTGTGTTTGVDTSGAVTAGTGVTTGATTGATTGGQVDTGGTQVLPGTATVGGATSTDSTGTSTLTPGINVELPELPQPPEDITEDTVVGGGGNDLIAGGGSNDVIAGEPTGTTTTEEDLLLEQIIRELEPTPPVSEGVPIPEPVFPEPPLVLPESPTINVGDRLTVRPVVDRGYRRPSVSPGSRVEESAQILPLRPGLSEGGTGGIEGTTEQEQEPVWNVRSLKLRRLLGI